LYNHLNYIHYNPVKHGFAKNVKDWEFSSFQKFVNKGYYDENWGTFEDIKEIMEMKLD
jgi:putative transposase